MRGRSFSVSGGFLLQAACGARPEDRAGPPPGDDGEGPRLSAAGPSGGRSLRGPVRSGADPFGCRSGRSTGPMLTLPADEQDPPRVLLGRGDRNCDHPARTQHRRASGGPSGVTRSQAPRAVAQLRRLRDLVPDDRDHLDQPPSDDLPPQGCEPRGAVPEPAAVVVHRHPSLVHGADGRLPPRRRRLEPRRINSRNRTGLLPYLIATPLAFVSPYITLAISAALAIFYALPLRIAQA